MMDRILAERQCPLLSRGTTGSCSFLIVAGTVADLLYMGPGHSFCLFCAA